MRILTPLNNESIGVAEIQFPNVIIMKILVAQSVRA